MMCRNVVATGAGRPAAEKGRRPRVEHHAVVRRRVRQADHRIGQQLQAVQRAAAMAVKGFGADAEPGAVRAERPATTESLSLRERQA
ncbi:TPA: hypothetical protein L2C79_004683, partial [Salmonella enterica subsp. enterica serovar Typhimurium]|nr:hypothetical protein [Salmonella enterica subsp. enterica serovar Typhimurium]